MMYEELLKLIQTTDDLALLRGELVELKKTTFSKDAPLVRREIVAAIEKDLIKAKLPLPKYADGLEKTLEKLEVVRLTFAKQLSAGNFAAVYRWFLDNLGVYVILDVYYNPGIVGGAQISFRGKYYDGSLLKRIQTNYSNF